MGTENRKVAVSYAWATEDKGAHEGAVTQFCDRLESLGIEVIRDTQNVNSGDSLKSFMTNLGHSNLLCIFLSDAYLKSANCMYELLIAWQHSRNLDDEFRKRVKVWVMPSAEGIYNMEDRLGTYVSYWNKKEKEVKKPVKKFWTKGLSPASLAEYKLVQDIAGNVDAMLSFIADSLAPSDIEIFQEWIESEFPEIGAEETEKKVELVYEQTHKEMLELLESNERLRRFLTNQNPEFFYEGVNGRQLSSAITDEEPKILPLMEWLAKNTKNYPSESLNDVEDLEKFVGGLLVSGVNKEWIRNNKTLLHQAAVRFSGDRPDLGFGDGAAVCFLQLLGNALTDSVVKLDRLFERTIQNKQILHDLPERLDSINEDQRAPEVMHYIVGKVMGLDYQPSLSEPERVKDAFIQAKQRMIFESQQGTPRMGVGTGMEAHAELIKKELNTTHLFLIFPKKAGLENAQLSDSIMIFSYLELVFEKLKKLKSTYPSL